MIGELDLHVWYLKEVVCKTLQLSKSIRTTPHGSGYRMRSGAGKPRELIQCTTTTTLLARHNSHKQLHT